MQLIKNTEDLLKNSPLVNAHGKIPTTTSLNIADKFEKRHADVLRSVENLECSKEFNKRNFALVDYMDTKGEKRPMYIITRDGFAFLAMGFTGKKAAWWKEQYITAFNSMEEILRRQQEPSLREKRCQGKDVRLIETGTIKRFIEYATEQGSTHADYYYVNSTLTTYRALFYFPENGWKEIRDILDGLQLGFVQSAEYTFKLALEHGMDQGWHYKKIFQYAKSELLEVTSRFGPKSHVPSDPVIDYPEKQLLKNPLNDILSK